MQKRMKLTSLKRIIKYAKYALATAIVILAFFLKDTIIQVWRGPVDIAGVNNNKLEKEYVSAEIETVYGKYSSGVLYSQPSGSYVIHAKGLDGVLGVKVENGSVKQLDTLAAQYTLNIESANEKNIIITGVVKKMSESDKKTYIEYLKKLGLEDTKSIEYYIQQTEAPYGSSAGMEAWSKLGLGIIIIVLALLLLGILGVYQCYVYYEMKKKYPNDKQLIKEEYMTGSKFSGDITIGQHYSYLFIGPIPIFFENEEIMSLYSEETKFEIKKGVKRRNVIIKTAHSKYRVPSKDSGFILDYYHKLLPEIEIFYSNESIDPYYMD